MKITDWLLDRTIPMLIGFAVVALIAAIVIPLHFVILETPLLRRCREAGYPDLRGSWTAGYFCHRRVQGTDELLPVERLP